MFIYQVTLMNKESYPFPPPPPPPPPASLSLSLSLSLSFICVSVSVILGVCWLIAVIIFAAEWPDYVGNIADKFGFSFALAIIAFIVAIVAGVLLIVDKKGGGTSPA